MLAMLFAAAAVVGDHCCIPCGTRSAHPLCHFSFRARLGPRDGQHLPDEDGGRLHDHDIDNCSLHSFDASLACNRWICHRGRPSVWKQLLRWERAGVSVVGFVGQCIYPVGQADRAEFDGSSAVELRLG